MSATIGSVPRTTASTFTRNSSRDLPVVGLRLGVVIPLANEEATVDELLGRVLAQLSKNDRVFCVLDNASRDRTRVRVQEFSTVDDRVVCAWAADSRCVVDAYFHGYRTALAAGCEWILEMDGGLSHSPEDVAKFLEQLPHGYDYIGGCRFMAGGSHDGGHGRYWLSRGGTLLANLFLRTGLLDMTGGFQCFNRRALEYVVEQGVHSRAHFFQTEIKYMLRDWNILEVPISYSSPSPSVGSGVVWEALRNLVRLKFGR